MALRYDERTGEFVETGGGSRRSSGGSSNSNRRSSGDSSNSTAESCGEKIGQGCGCLIMIWIVVKIAGCLFS